MIDHKTSCADTFKLLLEAKEAFEQSMNGSSQVERDELGLRYHTMESMLRKELEYFDLTITTRGVTRD